MPALEPISLAHTGPLRAVERCDRCGARATTRAVLANGGELVFCGHHANAHRDILHRDSINLQAIG